MHRFDQADVLEKLIQPNYDIDIVTRCFRVWARSRCFIEQGFGDFPPHTGQADIQPGAEEVSAVSQRHCSTEVGSALKKRIEKNRDKLFTFLDHDGVPWNNNNANNAEHAVRAFRRLRNVMGTSTPKGTTDYCVLLSLQQTLGCRGIGFLDFLRSGRTEI
jgi:hypothetical protein